MSPLDLSHSRFGPKAGLGVATTWPCPACGMQNEGRPIEQGCGHCGSGDPQKGSAGSTRAAAPAGQETTATPALPSVSVAKPSGAPRVEPPTRILRLIEYLVRPGQDFDPVLRRSLVGRIEMGWGTLTATIVDSVDPRQEDLLQLARKQPGVWLANPAAMEGTPRGFVRVDPPPLPFPTGPSFTIRKEPSPRMTQPEIPDTGPAFTATEQALAQSLYTLVGLRGINTLALALGNVAEELRGNSEPHKFLTPEECLSLANALLHEIPDDWPGEGQEPAAPDPTPNVLDPAVEARLARLREGSVPTATPWVDPTTRPGVL